jgi:hypothetical protein
MTTAQDIINAAYTRLGVLAEGQTLSGNLNATALDALNGMIDSWNTRSLFIYNINEVVYSASSGTITIGPGGNISIPRPLSIESSSFVRVNGFDYPLTSLGLDEYAEISKKNFTSPIPSAIFYTSGIPFGTLVLYPYPSTAVELHLFILEKLSAFADFATQYTLSDGYKRAMILSLCEELAPGLTPLDPLIANLAQRARRSIRLANSTVPMLESERANFTSNTARFLAG